ncbi:BREX system ATP-binding protein BrxD [Planomonospora parontospora]|uniref:BREX system ATP-binding protein BrxD n=1 Tax=Planomonospora parontospora TaxID=58119 RepID=UPI00166F9901|nr:BREX system ATP-binding protein BrxD [Planomonospora parontospora]GGL15894.1 ATP-binding protein [Planomonospora parontospora subsp. antibiotica]GII15439.1 ATP-binding protein [Planomonospora parontospora subsp. antibiotica]
MTVGPVSAARRREVIDALRNGAVPQSGLGLLAVGLARFDSAVATELDTIASGGAVFKAVRGEYGSGKTFFSRWLAEQAKQRGMATAEVQVSENETPLHRLETVYRRLTERLSTASYAPSALRPVVDAWFYVLEEDALAADPSLDGMALEAAVEELLVQRLAEVSRSAPTFAAALRGYRNALAAGDMGTAEAILAWLGGQPNVAAAARRAAGVRGDLDHFGALGFLQGLLAVLRDSGHPGLVLVLDEVETLQRVRSDARDKALNSLRQLIDEVHSGRFPGLYLLITGTPAFYDGPQGVQRLTPLAQRLAVDFTADARFDNPRAIQIRLPGFSLESLGELGRKVRDLYASGASAPGRVSAVVDDDYVAELASAVAGGLGGQVGVAPRIFLRKLVDVLDRVDQFDDFDPRKHYALTLSAVELTDVESNAASGSAMVRPAVSVDEVDLDLP